MINWTKTHLPTLGPVLEFPFESARRIFGWFTLKRILFIGKWIAVGSICISALFALLYLIENKRGKKEWERVKTKLESEGVPMDWDQYIPEPIPDESNFVAAPVIAHFQYGPTNPQYVPWQDRWGDEEHFETLFQQSEGGVIASESFILKGELVWHESRFERNERRRERLKSEGLEILPAGIDPWEQLEILIAPHRQLLVEMHDAAKSRPKSYIHGNYTGSPLGAPIPSISSVRNLASLLFADALCAISDDDIERALENAYTIHRLGNPNPDLSFLVNSMIEAVAQKGFEIPIYQIALKEGLLDNSQLNRLIEESLRRNALEKFEQTIMLEIAADSETIITQSVADIFPFYSRMIPSWSDILSELFLKNVFENMPEGWTYIMASRSAHYLSLLLDPYDEETGTLDLQAIERNNQTLGEMVSNAQFFNLLAAITLPAWNKILEQSLELHSQQDMLGIACALEKYRRIHDDLPESLEALLPKYLPELRKDPASGKNYRYERLDQDRYRLWAVGIDGRDDGGQFDETEGEHNQVDIIWPLSPQM